MENLIIQKALEIVKADFMQYPDYDEELEFTLLDALTVILSQHLIDTESSDIYNFLLGKLNK